MSEATAIPGATPLLLTPRPARRRPRRRRAGSSGQIELALGPLPPRPIRATRPRGVLAPQTRRLAIAPEAFAASPPAPAGRRGFAGLIEALVAMLATLACGLGWAAYELERAHPARAWDPLYAPTSAGVHEVPIGAVPPAGSPDRTEESAVRWRGEATSATQGLPGDGAWPGSSKP